MNLEKKSVMGFRNCRILEATNKHQTTRFRHRRILEFRRTTRKRIPRSRSNFIGVTCRRAENTDESSVSFSVYLLEGGFLRIRKILIRFLRTIGKTIHLLPREKEQRTHSTRCLARLLFFLAREQITRHYFLERTSGSC